MSTVETPFGFSSTAAEVLAGVDLGGRTAIVTGGASGIGVETVRALAGAGAAVTIAVRDIAAGQRVAAEIEASQGTPVAVAPLDLSSLDSIAAFATAWDKPLHILVDNAGVMAVQDLQTAHGWELQFSTNHLGTSRWPRLCTRGWLQPAAPASSR